MASSSSSDSAVKKPAAKPNQQFRVRFTAPKLAKTATSDLSAHSQAAKIYTSHLKLNPTQQHAVDGIHTNNLITERLFRALNRQEQGVPAPSWRHTTLIWQRVKM